MADPAADYGASLSQTAQSTGNSALNSFNPTDTFNQQVTGTNNLFDSQNKASNNYVSQYAGAVASNPTMQALYNQGNAQFNVPGLAQNATNLNNAVLQDPQNNVNLAKGFDYSNDQVQQQTSQDLARLSPLAASATNQSQQAQNLAGQYVQAGLQQNQMNLLPVQEQGTLLAQTMAAQATGFTQDQQNQLNGLISKMQSGVALSSQEQQMAETLAQQETAYQNALTQATASQNVAKIGAQNQTLAPGATYYNPVTGAAYNPFATPAKP